MSVTPSPGTLNLVAMARSGFFVHELDNVGLAGLLARLPTELIVIELEHRDDDGMCGRCARPFLRLYTRCAWDARLLLGWPLPAHADRWAHHG